MPITSAWRFAVSEVSARLTPRSAAQSGGVKRKRKRASRASGTSQVVWWSGECLRMCLRGWERERWFADSTTLRMAGQGFLPRVFTEGHGWFLFYPYNPWLMLFFGREGCEAPRGLVVGQSGRGLALHTLHTGINCAFAFGFTTETRRTQRPVFSILFSLCSPWPVVKSAACHRWQYR